jgi:dinuclear metal center YbgI/SA1388 family protein
MPTVAEIAADIEKLAPSSLAAEWDNVGLLVGDAAARVQRIMTCLTITPPVVAEAIAGRVELIVTHHPILFRETKQITAATAEGRMLLDLIRAGIAVISPHTAFDNAAGGINDQIAARLALADVRPLRRSEAGANNCKLVVFVPPADLARVSNAVFAAGAGRIGHYRECSFRVAGTGTFFGEDAAQPAIGQKGRREDVDELRLEVVCPESIVGAVIAAMRATHSYEEPAFDVYPLRPANTAHGEGRIGRLAAPCSLRGFAEQVRSAFEVKHVQVVGDVNQSVQLVALACGAGGEFLADAVRAGADVFLTGEMRFHGCIDAQTRGIAVVLPGHFATERFGVESLAVQLQKRWPACSVATSRSETDPIGWL